MLDIITFILMIILPAGAVGYWYGVTVTKRPINIHLGFMPRDKNNIQLFITPAGEIVADDTEEENND